MQKDKTDSYLDAFAWLVFEEVEKYVNEHRTELAEEENGKEVKK